ncbi:MAG: HNH endonuclease [Ruminococcus sp.]|nr:HNH endonuclease [Ruminococcus sp.]
MGKKIDLSGQKFGKLIVIHKITSVNKKNAMWKCQCDCGNFTEVSTCHLKSGHTKSCRHCQKFIIEDDHVKCLLDKGRFFIFDISDLELVKKYKWSINNYGYARTWSSQTGYVTLHRLLMGYPENIMVDHINGNRLDNRRCNLRLATAIENSWNSANRTNCNGYKGVTRHQSGKYNARITVNKVTISLGYYTTPFDAAVAYDKAAINYFGEFARLNFPQQNEDKEA